MYQSEINKNEKKIIICILIVWLQIIAFDELKTDYKNPIDQCGSLNPLVRRRTFTTEKTLFIFFPGVFSYPFNNLYVPGAAWVFTPPVLQHSFPLRRFGQKYFSRPVRNIWNIGGCHADKSINVMISNKILKDQDQTQIGIRWC